MENKKPNFAIIIPIYNVEKYLRDCLNSVIHQSYKELQIILIDDGSTDSSPQIAQEFFAQDERITLIRKANGGLSSARNAGLDYLFSPNLASSLESESFKVKSPRLSEDDGIKSDLQSSSCGGEQPRSSCPPPQVASLQVLAHQPPSPPDYIHFLDSDDWLDPHCIAACVEFWCLYPQIGILWHNYDCFLEERGERAPVRYRFSPDSPPLMSALEALNRSGKHLNFAWHGALRADLARKLRFIEGIEYEDVAYAFMLFAHNPIVGNLPQALLTYRIRPDSICNITESPTFPSYMKDLESVFPSFAKAKAYNFFYSDCINILRSHEYLSRQDAPHDLLKRLRELLAWRANCFLCFPYKIKADRDPRFCLELYKKLCSFGYVSPFYLRIWLYLWLRLKAYLSSVFRALGVLEPILYLKSRIRKRFTP